MLSLSRIQQFCLAAITTGLESCKLERRPVLIILNKSNHTLTNYSHAHPYAPQLFITSVHSCLIAHCEMWYKKRKISRLEFLCCRVKKLRTRLPEVFIRIFFTGFLLNVFFHINYTFFFYYWPPALQSISLKCCEMVVNQIANPLWDWVSALLALQKVKCHVTGRCEPYGPQWEPLFSGDTGSLGPLTSSLFKVREMPSKNSCERTKTGQKERRTLWNHMHIFCQ